MRTWLPMTVGTVLVVVGAVWASQGFGLLQGSPMSGVGLWAIVGPIVSVLGLVLMARAALRGRSD